MLSLFGRGTSNQPYEEPLSVEHKLITKLQTRDESSVNDEDFNHENFLDGQREKLRLVINSEGELDKSLLRRTTGYMYKKGGAVNVRGGFRTWKKRWFVLEEVSILGHIGYELQYFDRPNDNDTGGSVMKGAVGLSDVEIQCDFASSTQDPATDKSSKLSSLLSTTKPKIRYEFQIALQNGGILELGCDSPLEREEWVDTLQMVVAFLKKVLTSPSMAIDGYDPCLEDDHHIYSIGKQLAANCMAFGPGIFGSEAGQAVQCLVQIHDLMGQQVFRGGMPLTAVITDYPPSIGEEDDPRNEEVQAGHSTSSKGVLYYLAVEDKEDGTYLAHYMLGAKGKYYLSIRINDEHHIFGSPFHIEVLPSKTDSRFCFCTSGERAVSRNNVVDEFDEERLFSPMFSSLRADSTISFLIIARDGYGNRKSKGGDPFEVGLLGPAQLLALIDNQDGSYSCKLQTSNPNRLNSSISAASLVVMVTLHGKHIKGSPFKIGVLSGAQPNVSNIYSPFQDFSAQHIQSRIPPPPPPSLSSSSSVSTSQKPYLPPETPIVGVNKQSHSSASSPTFHAPDFSPSPIPAPQQANTPQGLELAQQFQSNSVSSYPDPVPHKDRHPSIESSQSFTTQQSQSAEAGPTTAGKPNPSISRTSAAPVPSNQTMHTPAPLSHAPISTTGGGTMSRLERARQRALIAKTLSESINPAQDGSSVTPQPSSESRKDPAPSQLTSSSKLSAIASKSMQTLQEKKASMRPAQVNIHSSPSTNDSVAAPSSSQSLPPQKQQQQQQQQRVPEAPLLESIGSSRQNSRTSQADGSSGVPSNIHFNIPGEENLKLVNELVGELKKGFGSATAPPTSSPEEQLLWERTHSALSSSGVATLLCQPVTLAALRKVFSYFGEDVDGVWVLKLTTSSAGGGLYRLLDVYGICPAYLSRAQGRQQFQLVTSSQRGLKSAAASYGLDLALFLKLLVMMAIHSAPRAGATASSYSAEAKVDLLLRTWELTNTSKLQALHIKKN